MDTDTNKPFTDGGSGEGGQKAVGQKAGDNPSWKREQKGTSLSSFIERKWKLLIGLCIVCIIIVLIFMPDENQKEKDKLLKSVDAKTELLISRVDKLETTMDNFQYPAETERKIQILKERIDSLETALNTKYDEFGKKLDELYAKNAPPEKTEASDRKEAEKKEPPKKVEPVKPEKKTSVKPKPTVRHEPKTATPAKSSIKYQYHTVSKGDTLYSIARRYGMTTQQLCATNKIAPTSIIRPGQKLLVMPSKKR